LAFTAWGWFGGNNRYVAIEGSLRFKDKWFVNKFYKGEYKEGAGREIAMGKYLGTRDI
jgi:hypothetical protein